MKKTRQQLNETMQARRRWMWEYIRDNGGKHTAEIARAVNSHFKSTTSRASYNKELKTMREHPAKFLDHFVKNIKGSTFIYYSVPAGAQYHIIDTSETSQRLQTANAASFADLGNVSKWFGYVKPKPCLHNQPLGIDANLTSEQRKKKYGKNGVYFMAHRPDGIDRPAQTNTRGVVIGTAFQQTGW